MTVEVSPKEIRFPSDPRMPRRCLQRAGELVDRQNSLTSWALLGLGQLELKLVLHSTMWVTVTEPSMTGELFLWSYDHWALQPHPQFPYWSLHSVHSQFSKCNPGLLFFLLFRKELTAAECACVNVSGQYGVVHNGQLVGCSFLGGVFLFTHLHVACRINLSQETILN